MQVPFHDAFVKTKFAAVVFYELCFLVLVPAGVFPWAVYKFLPAGPAARDVRQDAARGSASAGVGAQAELAAVALGPARRVDGDAPVRDGSKNGIFL